MQAPRCENNCLDKQLVQMFPRFNQVQLQLGNIIYLAAVHTLLQLPQIWQSTMFRSGLLAGQTVGVMKSGVSWAKSYAISRALWTAALSLVTLNQ